MRASREVITPADLPREVLSMCPRAEDGHRATCTHAIDEELFERMVHERRDVLGGGVRAVHGARSHAEDLRAIVKQGLSQTRGGYKTVAGLFNIPADHRRLLTFLRKHDCHLPEQDFRSVPASLSRAEARRA